jgi:hypothetical protein
VETNAGGSKEEEALCKELVYDPREWPMEGGSYGGVDGLISFHGGGLVRTMVCLAKGDARDTPGDQAYFSRSVAIPQFWFLVEILQVSIGLQHPKKPVCHSRASAGDLELTCSLGLARTSLKRFFHCSTSWSLMGPALAGAGAPFAAGAAISIIFNMRTCKKFGKNHLSKATSDVKVVVERGYQGM